MPFSMRLALCFALLVVFNGCSSSAAFLYYERTSQDRAQCAQAQATFVHMFQCDFCFSSGVSSSFMWMCNMTYAEKFEWSSSPSCSGGPADSSRSVSLYVCEDGKQPFVAEGTSDTIMGGILDLAFAPGKIFTVASYFHSSQPDVCPGGVNAPEITATSAFFCGPSPSAIVTLCNETHVDELTCTDPNCGPGTCTVTRSTAIPCAQSASGAVKLSCRIDVLAPPQGTNPPPQFAAGNPNGGFEFPPFNSGDFPPFDPSNMPPFDPSNMPPFDPSNMPPFNPNNLPPFDPSSFPPGMNNLPPFDGSSLPPGFNSPPMGGGGITPPVAAPRTAPVSLPTPIPAFAPTPSSSVAVKFRLSVDFSSSITSDIRASICPRVTLSVATVLAVAQSRLTCTIAPISAGKRAIQEIVSAEIIATGDVAVALNTSLTGPNANATVSAIAAPLLQLPGARAVSSFSVEQVPVPPTAAPSVAPSVVQAPSNAKASDASQLQLSIVSMLFVVAAAVFLVV